MVANAGLGLATLLITAFDPSLLSGQPCLSQSYYGSFSGRSIFRPDPSCLELVTDSLPSGTIVPASKDMAQLVWIEEQAIDDSLKSPSGGFDLQLEELLTKISTLGTAYSAYDFAGEREQVLGPPITHYDVMYRSGPSALLSLPADAAKVIDTIIPPFWKSTLLLKEPITYVPVPSDAVQRVRALLDSVKFDPTVAAIVSNISVPQMKNDIRFLTGEDGKSGIISRHSFSSGVRTAAAWLSDRFEDTGATCELRPFLAGFAPNVVCRYPSTVNTTATVLLSAHYDSRGSFGSTRAPGGDDDGSGTVALLAIARTIARKGITFRSNVELVAFSGEEQGLLGSKAYAREMREAGTNLTLMVQADMLAYHAPGEPAQLGLPDLIGTPEVSQLVANLSAIYSPELQVGLTPACCSDHQSFHEQGFPSTQVFERAGPIIDPMYHNSGDLSEREGYDFEQLKSIAKVQFATLLTAAGFDLPE
ncbi:Zn-dependent exopeptidase [Gloeophyllum trabeum ATCC 11539]|uniref:Peptide hydrolase n=1 Tax=Gloeophyllum trabeum (strain ATCC 11539 / FP-39264 / Madison 617) TaxID=670483 RepID=S7QFD7_GLOTA|nr:Zn-dependent exopeptidase [Gloeophyllum trabeum ATCC 11539]EPQ58122.1 Zn-dependent exopeptidase [Gloeophyllum trabeum ATCC 11539]